MDDPKPAGLTRRAVFAGGAAVAGAATLLAGQAQAHGHETAQTASEHDAMGHGGHGEMMTVGTVDDASNGFSPSAMLTDWERGETSRLPDGRTLRTFRVYAADKEIEIAPGVFFPAWTYNDRVPGPALRAMEGERLRVIFTNNGSHPHSMHFHGMHSARMDGVPGAGVVGPGEEFTYEFDARPFGLHLYHCHAMPLRRHMHKGMYGMFVIDPDPALHPEAADVAASRLFGSPENAGWQEMMMVMNAFDTSFDGENEVYAVNTVAHAYAKAPIRVTKDKPVRVYLVNVTEFDPINSFHLHANFFDYFDTGTNLAPTLRTVDLITQCQAQRGILEFSFKDHEPGQYMFHAHQSEFAELGWMGMFDVVEAAS